MWGWTMVIGGMLASQAPAGQDDSQAVRAHSLSVLVRRIDHYVDQSKKPAVVKWIASERERLLRIEGRQQFIEAVNAGLRQASGDKHLSLFFREADAPAADDVELGTFGIGKAELLPGEVAYLELNGFSNAPESVAAVDGVMSRLSGARALILDLRRNGGGGEVSFLRTLGHLFPARTEISSIEWRQCAPPPPDRPDACVQIEPRLERRFTNAPADPAFPTQPIFVLVSKESFSAAEAIAHELQVQGRATVIGERTPGGGNPSAGMDLESRYVVIMPIGRGIALNGTSFEGSGVAPNVPVDAARALETALARIGSAASQPSSD